MDLGTKQANNQAADIVHIEDEACDDLVMVANGEEVDALKYLSNAAHGWRLRGLALLVWNGLVVSG